MVLTSMKQTVILLLLIIMGMICSKAGILNRERAKGLSDLLLYFITPCLIFSRLQVDYDKEHALGLIFTILAIAVSFGIFAALSQLFFHDDDKSRLKVSRFAATYPNTGYMGLPLIGGVLGPEGGFFAIGGVIVFNIYAFTHGIITMRKDEEKLDLKKVILSPAIIAVCVGFFFFATQIRMPEVIIKPIDIIAETQSPLAMLVAGNSLASSNLRAAHAFKRMIQVIFNRLLLYPAIIAVLISLVPISNFVKMVVIISMSCPTAAITVMYAVKYDHDDVYASELMSVTTLLSIVTIPLIVALSIALGVNPTFGTTIRDITTSIQQFLL